AVVVADERQQVPRRQLQLTQELLVAEGLVADDVDLANLRALTLLDLDGDAHAVIRKLLDRRRDLPAVLAAGVVFLGQRSRDLVEDRAIVGLPAGETDVAQGLRECIVLDVLVAAEGELLDRRPL